MTADEFRVQRQGDDSWRVHLPHQCDSWDIAGDEYLGVPRDQAAQELAAFLTDGLRALVLLQAGREYRDGKAADK